MRLLALLFLLAACGAPHPLDGLTRSATASAGGHDFRVNWNRDTAQATRMNRVWRPKLVEIVPAAIVATERVTGCRVPPGSAVGDVALVNMTLDCDAP